MVAQALRVRLLAPSLPDAHLSSWPAPSVRHALHGHAIPANDGAAGLEAIVMLLHVGYSSKHQATAEPKR